MTRRVLIVQFAGDYREAVKRFAAGGSETYFAQRYSVDAVAQLSALVPGVTVLACITDEQYEEQLPNGVKALGGGFKGKIVRKKLLSMVEKEQPTDLIVCTPIRPLFQWAVDHKVRTMALLADSFRSKNLPERYRNRRMANVLNRPEIEWVANHNINACRSLEDIGIDSNKIVPWDWNPTVTPEEFEAKHLCSSQGEYRLLYAGSIIEEKGVADLLRSIAILKDRKVSATVQLAGKGDLDRFKSLTVELGIADRVFFLGAVSNRDVVDLMRDADAVVIPSRHSYAEGLPMTIYEALCSRTPILASDHPMFRNTLKHGWSALVFQAANPEDLANQAANLFSDPILYAALSENSLPAWREIQIPVKFGELLQRWVCDSEEDRVWIRTYGLASGKYHGR